jgi:hypothetical protein
MPAPAISKVGKKFSDKHMEKLSCLAQSTKIASKGYTVGLKRSVFPLRSLAKTKVSQCNLKQNESTGAIKVTEVQLSEELTNRIHLKKTGNHAASSTLGFCPSTKDGEVEEPLPHSCSESVPRLSRDSKFKGARKLQLYFSCSNNSESVASIFHLEYSIREFVT